jgi:hypothetical protein
MYGFLHLGDSEFPISKSRRFGLGVRMHCAKNGILQLRGVTFTAIGEREHTLDDVVGREIRAAPPRLTQNIVQDSNERFQLIRVVTSVHANVPDTAARSERLPVRLMREPLIARSARGNTNASAQFLWYA